MQLCNFASICLILFWGTRPTLTAATPPTDFQEYVAQLNATAGYTDLKALMQKWQSSLPRSMKKDLSIELLRLFPSKKPLKLEGIPKVLVEGIHRIEVTDGIVVETANIYQEGGRAAWALSRLLEISLHSSRPAAPEAERNRDYLFAYRGVFHAMDWPVERDLTISKLGEHGKLALASSNTCPTLALARLGEDANSKVRLAVARDASIPVIVLGRLFDDRESSVQAAALKNLFDGDPKRPGGWQRQNLSKEAELEAQRLFGASTFKEMRALVDEWRSKLSFDARRQTASALLKTFQSQRPLKVMGTPKVVFAVNEEPRQEADLVVVRNDVYQEGGRAAWALSELLDVRLPALPPNPSPEDLFKIHQQAYEIAIQAMDWPLGRDFTINTLDDEAKLKLASLRGLPGPVMMRLAGEANVKIRLAIAKHPRAPITVLSRLREDTDPEVRKSAQKNLHEGSPLRPLY